MPKRKIHTISKGQTAPASKAPIILILIGGLFMLGGLLALLLPGMRAGTSPTATLAEARLPYPDISRVSLADGRAAYETGTAIFIDVRDKTFYDEKHIPGSLSYPQDELAERLADLDTEAWYITLCT